MSSQFSYDLDERQIKMLLQHAEVDYNEAAWQKFESLPQSEEKLSFEKVIPKINIHISRSIVVPILFIVLIGGFSTLLFSFVDFKKKSNSVTEVPLVTVTPIKNNLKPKLISKEVPLIAAVEIIKTATVINKPIKLNEEVVKEQVKVEVKPEIEETKIVKTKIQPVESKKSNNLIITKKKKRKTKSVELPSIKASTNLNEGNSEPELELR